MREFGTAKEVWVESLKPLQWFVSSRVTVIPHRVDGSANPEVRVERIGSQVVANMMAMSTPQQRCVLTDGDTESAMSEDVPMHRAEHNVILEDAWGPVSS